MQAVYSTATDVKIHKAIRHEWASFQVWLFNQRKRLERREHQILSAAQRKWGQLKKTDKQEIVALQQELLVVARRQWLARVRQRQLHLEHWVMTPEEKHMLQQMLGWTQREMIDAYAREQAEMGPMYQRVDPTTLGTRDSGPSHLLNSPSRFMHPPERTGIPAYTNWASELAKMSAASSHKPQPQPSIKSVELPSMPLYFVGALLQGADLDAVAAADLEAFALHASEEKIREYYFDACEASVHFQRILATINPSQRDAAQQEFERRMRDLASAKEREWKAMAVKALRQHQATEMEHRAAQQRAMRSPPRRPRRRDLSDWDYLEEYHSPRRDPDYSSTYQSSQQDYVEAYQSPREDYLDPYHSLLSPPDLVEAYNSPRPRRKNQRPVVEEDYVSGGGIRRLRSLAQRTLRNAGSISRRAVGDWSAVRVDEMDLKTGSIPSGKKTSRRGLDFILRLDGIGNEPRSARRRTLKKRKKENVASGNSVANGAAAKSGNMGRSGRVFRGRVPDSEREISLERKVQLESPQTDKAKSLTHQFGHRLGRGFGLDPDPTRDGVASEPRARAKLDRAFKHVRFTPSALPAGSITANSKRPASKKLNIDQAQSKFYEGFTDSGGGRL
ncbi:hypothetical protein C8F04DRAFT_1120732 [Mycena alexandri]|uniref:Uncharacterized protein n=1 Tax=Mycena alexandri TaxID=1745969 RepID=A0AAD6SID2_9AGAR|nr:hypothetical protein C8F04DRAFT_1120732 [Mycena alexandri]